MQFTGKNDLKKKNREWHTVYKIYHDMRTLSGIKIKKNTKVVLTFFCSISYDNLSTSLAGLLHRQRRAEALLVLPQALAFFEAVLLHDLMGHRTSVGVDREKKNF